MQDSVFTKMLKGEIPREVIYQDDVCFIIPTIAPNNEGHCMVIPVEQVEDWETLDTETYQYIMDIVQKFGKVIKKTYDCPKVGVVIEGLEVPHVHVHVLPIYKTGDLDHTRAHKVEYSELKPVADKLRVAIKEQGGL